MTVSAIGVPTPPTPQGRPNGLVESSEATRVAADRAATFKGASLNDAGVFANIAVAVEQMADPTGKDETPGDAREKMIETTAQRQEELGALAAQKNASAHAAAATETSQTETHKLQRKRQQAQAPDAQDQEGDRRSKGLKASLTDEDKPTLKRAASTGDIAALGAKERHQENKALRRTKSMSSIEVADEVIENLDGAVDIAKKTAAWAGIGGAIGTAIFPGIGTAIGAVAGATLRLIIEGAKWIMGRNQSTAPAPAEMDLSSSNQAPTEIADAA